MANPPFVAPDEADHYIRALGLAQGHLVGHPAPRSALGGTPRQAAWTAQVARVVVVPPRLAPQPYNCVFDARASAACQDRARPVAHSAAAISGVGTYQPLPYLVPGAAARLGASPPGADRLGRLAGLVVALALLAIAAALTADGALLGLALAVPPMVLFVAASVTSSSLEIAAGLAFAAAVLRLARDPVGSRERAALGLTGCLLALSRSPGPLWVALLLALGAALAGPRRLLRRAGAASLAVIGAGVVLNRVYEAAYGPSLTVDLDGGAGESVRQAARSAAELVGRFGYREWRLPAWVVVVWGLLLVALVLSARRRRLIAEALAACALLLPVFWWVALRGSGFGMQGRHVLPVVVAVPLLAGALAAGRVRPALATAGAAGIAVVQVAAFWLNARRAATGIDGPLLFPGRAEWSPPGGWIVWLAAAAAGAILVAFGAWSDSLRALTRVSNREHK